MSSSPMSFSVPTHRRITARTVTALSQAISHEFRLIGLATMSLSSGGYSIAVTMGEGQEERAPFVKAFANGFLCARNA